ncbi:hypothetical protein D3C81_212770 [compost metagenome]
MCLGLDVSGLNMFDLNVFGLNVSSLNVSGLNVSGLNVFGLNVTSAAGLQRPAALVVVPALDGREPAACHRDAYPGSRPSIVSMNRRCEGDSQRSLR